MELYQLIIAYDGTEYHGFQRQKGQITIQSEIESALRKIGWVEKSILSAGRTDAGVHANGQVASFNLEWKHSLNDLKNALNSHLPNAIAIKNVNLADKNFHPRYDAISREYIYSILLSDSPDPQIERFAWRIKTELNFKLLKKAAKTFIGIHDFSYFGKATSEGGSTIREVFSSKWTKERLGKIQYHVKGNAFLYHMVRRMVSVMVSVSQEKLNLNDLEMALKKIKSLDMQGIAPAHGLILEKVNY